MHQKSWVTSPELEPSHSKFKIENGNSVVEHTATSFSQNPAKCQLLSMSTFAPVIQRSTLRLAANRNKYRYTGKLYWSLRISACAKLRCKPLIYTTWSTISGPKWDKWLSILLSKIRSELGFRINTLPGQVLLRVGPSQAIMSRSCLYIKGQFFVGTSIMSTARSFTLNTVATIPAVGKLRLRSSTGCPFWTAYGGGGGFNAAEFKPLALSVLKALPTFYFVEMVTNDHPVQDGYGHVGGAWLYCE